MKKQYKAPVAELLDLDEEICLLMASKADYTYASDSDARQSNDFIEDFDGEE